MTTAAQRAFFARVAAALPEIPTFDGPHGKQVAPCAGGFPSRHVNGENVETYAVWPYEYYAVNRTDAKYPVSVGRNTYDGVHFGHGNSAWRYDAQDCAVLGRAADAWRLVEQRLTGQGTTQGSRFPGYLARDAGDGAPQVESNGIAAAALQKMLVQTDGQRIILFPSWPKGWDAQFRFHLRGPVTVEAELANGTLKSLGVDPPARRADVIILPLQ